MNVYLKLEKEDERLNVIEIKEGDVFSNYKDLCQALGITPKSGGKSKQLQLKDIERYLEYKKEGRYGFLITKVFKEPKIRKRMVKKLKDEEWMKHYIHLPTKDILNLGISSTQEIFWKCSSCDKNFSRLCKKSCWL